MSIHQLREELMVRADQDMPPSDETYVEKPTYLYATESQRYLRFFWLKGQDGVGLSVVVAESLLSLDNEFHRVKVEAGRLDGRTKVAHFEQISCLRAGGSAAHPRTPSEFDKYWQ